MKNIQLFEKSFPLLFWQKENRIESTMKFNTFLGRKRFENYLCISWESNWVPHNTDPGKTERDHPLMEENHDPPRE